MNVIAAAEIAGAFLITQANFMNICSAPPS